MWKMMRTIRTQPLLRGECAELNGNPVIQGFMNSMNRGPQSDSLQGV